jgi:hypothetical protein
MRCDNDTKSMYKVTDKNYVYLEEPKYSADDLGRSCYRTNFHNASLWGNRWKNGRVNCLPHMWMAYSIFLIDH